ncbi:hypothetical protein ZWY2020_004402 [Hordeum vulgare]|nr:hypothetical protein ZWY2020_004402 [Hordeum vulgare]
MQASYRGGNRLWALAGSDSDDSDDEEGQDCGSGAAAYSPTPSYYVCESLQVGYSEEEVAGFIDGIVPASDRAWDGLGKADAVEVIFGFLEGCIRTPEKEAAGGESFAVVGGESRRDPSG